MKLILTILALFATFNLFSQGEIEGKVIEAESKIPSIRTAVKIVSPIFEQITYTNEQGEFKFINLRTGTYTLIISDPGYFEYSIDIDYVAGESMKLDDILIEKQQQGKDVNNEIPTVDQADDESVGASGTAVASLLNSSRDVFVSNAMFGLGQGGYRFRGFRFQDQTMFINGIPFENILRGNELTPNDFTGLNDVLRSRNNYYGIKAIPFAFGEQTNNVDIDAEAINQRKGFRLSQWFSNRNFTSRTTVTYSTGLMKNNFAISGSASFRGAKEGYIPGTAMQSISAFLSISKLWSSKFNSTLTAFYVDHKRSVATAVTKEFYELAGTNYYNPSWGYYNGDKRSANIRRDNVPMIILSTDYKPSNSTHIIGSIGYQFGKRYQERLDWYNSYNPSPNYYRNAPSFDSVTHDELYTLLKSNPDLLQINWNNLYQANYGNTETVPTKGITGKWARYILNKETSDIKNISANINVKHQLNNHIDMNGGLMFQMNSSEFYRQISDLLGADFFVNVNQFAQRSNPTNPNAIQNDLNNPYQIVKVGDKYGFDYKANAMNITAWAQSIFTFNQVDGFFAVKVENTSYSRTGLFKNGAYADNSFGKSNTASFTNFSVKGGLTYKLNGKNYFSINGARWSNSPQYEQVFPIARTSNVMDNAAKSNTIYSGELSYYHRGARVKGNITGYYTLSTAETEVRRFYTELTNSFGTLLMKDMDKRYMGLEAAIESKIGNTGFTATALASIGDYVYNNRPTSMFFYDNSNETTAAETVYFKGLHIATGPQIAGIVKLGYNSKQFWSATLSINYFDKIYVDPSPQRRTQEAVDNIPENSELYNKILTQERMSGAITVDAYFRKSIMLNKFFKGLKKRMYFDISANISNILDKKDYAIVGREQLRFDFRDNNPDKFPNVYNYMMGRSYFVNFIFRM